MFLVVLCKTSILKVIPVLGKHKIKHELKNKTGRLIYIIDTMVVTNSLICLKTSVVKEL